MVWTLGPAAASPAPPPAAPEQRAADAEGDPADDQRPDRERTGDGEHELDEELDDIARLLGGVALVLTDGFLPELALPLCREARARGIPVVLDGGSWKPWSGELVPHVDCAIVSERFFPGGRKAPDVLAALHALGPKLAAVTRGERALSWSDGARRGEIVPPQVAAIDTLGAGDVFHGAFCHYRAAGADFPGALERAAEIAAQSCRHFGTRAWIAERA